jgi:hypothetical protein
MKHDAIFVLSTGRCGTQWLHHMMTNCYSDLILSMHEPLPAGYQPRNFFRAPPARLNTLGGMRAVAEHVSSIRQCLRHRPYFEAGWPCYAALPWLYDALDGRLKIVHLTRHPVTTAFSTATHAVYGREDWIRESVLTPFDAGCLRPDLQSKWPKMSMYEKCLFWWTQIHRYALDLHRDQPAIPWLRISFEEMFKSNSDDLERLVEFCDLPKRPQLQTLRSNRVDRFQFRAPPDDWRKILRHPDTIAVAEVLGYDAIDVDPRWVSQRYFKEKKQRPTAIAAMRLFWEKVFN